MRGQRDSGPTTAVVVAVGSELLTPHKTDTNSLFITDRLNAVGIDVVQKLVVGTSLPALRVRCATPWALPTSWSSPGGLDRPRTT